MLKLQHAVASTLRLFLGGAFGVLLLAVLGAGALVLRLSHGPVDVSLPAHLAATRWVPDLQLATATLALDGRTLRLHATGLQLPLSGTDVAVKRADVALPLDALLRGQVQPEEVDATGLRLHLVRQPGKDEGTGGGLPSVLDRLRRLHLADSVVEVDDRVLGLSWSVTIPDLTATRDADGTLRAEASLHLAAAGLAASGTLQVNRHGERTEMHLVLQPLDPAQAAAAVPQLSALKALDAPVSLDARVELDGTAFRAATVHAEIGEGHVSLPVKEGTTVVPVRAAVLDASATSDALDLTGLRVVLAPPSGAPPTTVAVSGTATRAGPGFRATLAADIDQARFADLDALWPKGLSSNARDWLVANVTAGRAHDGHFTATLTANADGSNIALAEVAGGLQADDVTLFWLRPGVPPVEHAHAELAMEGPDALVITARDGRTGAITLTHGRMRITGLTVKDQFTTIELDLAAPLPAVFHLLGLPRLHLLSDHPLPIKNPAGQAAAHLHVFLPLEKKTTFKDIDIHATARITDARLGDVVAGKDLTRGQFTLDVTQNGLGLKGPAMLAQVPVRLDVAMDFTPGPPDQVTQRIGASFTATDRQLKASGLDVSGILSGRATGTLDYAEHRSGIATVAADAVLDAAAITSPLGWTKPAGAAGHASARVTLRHGKLVAVDHLQADAPGLSLLATGEAAGGRASVLHIQRAILGRSNVSGTVELPLAPGQSYRATLRGPSLDLSPQGSLRTAMGSGNKADSGDFGTPFVVDLAFDRLLFGPNRVLGPASLRAVNDGRRVVSAELRSGGPEQLVLRLRPDGVQRRLTATAADLGHLLRQGGVEDSLVGGVLDVDAAFQDRIAGAPLVGTITLDRFSVKGLPIVGKILQGLTLYGLVDAFRGPGLVFDRLASRFRLDTEVLDIDGARAYSSSLGVTAGGRMDFGRGTLSIEGTVVPAYFFNALPGRIPVIGKLFSPEPGGGLFAADYGLHGRISDPSLRLNPLSVLTPGILRDIFDLF